MSIVCFYWQRYSDIPLLEFVLGVMAFAYSGLLGVYITAVFSKRGSTASVIAALAVGFIVVMLFQPFTIDVLGLPERSEEHTSELQSLMRISYAVFCLKKKQTHNNA